MMDNPWVPMLRTNPVIPYDYKAWCCNHIWVHKQPLFMWQMALSMKVFGVNEIAMRLPSAIMGTVAVGMIYRTAGLWIKDKAVAYIAALFFALSYYQLELTSGYISLEHNDLTYGFYVLASIWAYVEYRSQPNKSFRWILLIGLFVGCAVLNKWLTGLLVFAGWGTMLLLNPDERTKQKNWLHMAAALFIAVVVFLPWQIYTAHQFPIETAWEQHFNLLHITEALDNQSGDAFFHVRFMETHYGFWLIPFLVLGIILLFVKGWLKRAFTIEMLVMFLVIYLFFSQVATKMPAFTFVVAPIGFMLVAFAISEISGWLSQVFGARKWIVVVWALPLVLLGFRPWGIIEYRSGLNQERNAKIHNTVMYKEAAKELSKDYLVFNCKSFEDVEMMFHTQLNAYHWFPEVSVLDSLINTGHKVAIFQSHGNQVLPEAIANHTRLTIIKKELW